MAHARKKILCVDDDREISALGLSAANGTSCFTETAKSEGCKESGAQCHSAGLRLVISSKLVTLVRSALWVRFCLENCSSW